MRGPSLWWAMGAPFLLFASCATQEDDARVSEMNSQQLASDVAFVKTQRILFAHQSVGNDILLGVKELTEGLHIPPVNIVPLRETHLATGNFICDAIVGTNGAPNVKCDAFAEMLEDPFGQSLDIAMMKFCYVDIQKSTNVAEIFAYYKETFKNLRSDHPHLVFIHVTVPLRTRYPSWRRIIKTLLGQEIAADIEASKRTEFNALLMKEFAGDPVFDLAKVESTFGDGTRNSFEVEGKTVFALIDEYTEDGGHLNALGRRLAAREFLRTLANGGRGQNE